MMTETHANDPSGVKDTNAPTDSLFQWLWQRLGRKKEKKPTFQDKTLQAFGQVKEDMQQLQTQVDLMAKTAQQHEQLISRHDSCLKEHTHRLADLESRIKTEPVTPDSEISQSISRPIAPTDRLVPTHNESDRSSGELDLDHFSIQERKILQTFLTHKNMALSYLDIAKSLHKSPHTVKNQLRQISMKADLFDKFIDEDRKNRFKLKDKLKLKTSLGND